MSISIEGLRYTPPGSLQGLSVPDVTLAAGETLAVIGPSGSGKTTFLNLLSALTRPDNGDIRVGDLEVSDLSVRQAQSYRARSVGYIFQDFGLLEYLSAMDNILHPFRICAGLKVTDTERERARRLADDLGIGDRLARLPAHLSHGERQRVAICRAVVTLPSILLADEPTGNLDPETALRIMDSLFEVHQKSGSTLVMVTHDHSLLDRFDHVLDFKNCWVSAA